MSDFDSNPFADPDLNNPFKVSCKATPRAETRRDEALLGPRRRRGLPHSLTHPWGCFYFLHFGGSPKIKVGGSGCNLWPFPLEPPKRREERVVPVSLGMAPRWANRAVEAGGVGTKPGWAVRLLGGAEMGFSGGPRVVGIGGRLLPSVRLSWGPEEAGGGGERESWLHCLEGWRER